MTHHASISRRAPHRREGGQALVEFVLILFPLIVIVGGVIQLGIGISNWHDANRIANEGARFAATNEWPDCPAAALTCTLDPPCSAAKPALYQRSLLNYLRCEASDAELPAPNIVVCAPAGSGVGKPVTVKLASRINFLSLEILDLNKVKWAGLTLRGEATMRVAVPPTKYAAPAC